MAQILEQPPRELAAQLRAAGIRRGYLVFDPERRGYAASHPELEEVAEHVAGAPECADHEAIFFQVAESAPTLFAAFVHRTVRGQAQGGLRRRAYETTEKLLRDGLRLSRTMTRKCALAGLWWGGGKGLLADDPEASADPERRRALYREYGAFVSSLRGCYVTAEDAGTTPVDMSDVASATRFATCVPPDAGGSGNPAYMTALGVVCAMEAALDFHGMGSLRGKKVALQGTGHVGTALIELLLEHGALAVGTDVSAARRAALLDRHEGQPVDVRLVSSGDDSILSEPCDVLAPCALGGVLGPKSIPNVRARIVCGAANDPLEHDERDASALAHRGVTYVPDFLANRMGIVHCSNEQYGYVNRDPSVFRHLGHDWPNGIYLMTLRVLELAARGESNPFATAARLADDLADEPHPVWGHRGRRIVESLVADHWERQTAR